MPSCKLKGRYLPVLKEPHGRKFTLFILQESKPRSAEDQSSVVFQCDIKTRQYQDQDQTKTSGDQYFICQKKTHRMLSS